MIRDLQASRERLVVAREEERRRLRRDLHDGLGPSIAGMLLQVSAAGRAIIGQPKAREYLERLGSDLRLCADELRRLVEQLRPAALDGGLVAALRRACRQFDDDDLTVTLAAPLSLDGLPAATEVAAYRIVTEALANVSRHARASRCTVTVHNGESLVVSIVDDGIGFNPGGQRGVGIASMRERAEELGGTCVVTRAEPTGTMVAVELPVRSEVSS